MAISGTNSVSTNYDPIQYRRNRLNDLRHPNNKINQVDDKSDTEKVKHDEKDPFGRLVKAIKAANLTTSEKKSKLHYAKTALSLMNEDQARTFVKNIKKLLTFKTPRLGFQTRQKSNPIFEMQLSEQRELARKLREKLNIKDDLKIKIPFYANSIDQYVDYLNEKFKQFNQDPVKQTNSIDALS